MIKTIIYIHGKGDNAEEAIHYKPLFGNCDVIGFNYGSQTPWEAMEEFPEFFDTTCRNAQPVEIIANSIGAFFAMNALSSKRISKAYFISPVVDMKKLIFDMMLWANVTEEDLETVIKLTTTHSVYRFETDENCISMYDMKNLLWSLYQRFAKLGMLREIAYGEMPIDTGHEL